MLIKAFKPSYNRIFTCARTSIRYFCDKKDDDAASKVSAAAPEKVKDTSKDADAASDRLNKLLSQMSTENVQHKKTVEIPRPKKDQRNRFKNKDSDDEKPKNIVDAAKKVAKSMKGDQRLTEMELLSKILGVPAKGDTEKKTNLSNVISGLQIHRDEPLVKVDPSRAEFVRNKMREYNDKRQSFQQPRERKPKAPRPTQPAKRTAKIDLFGAQPLDIFTETKATPKEFLETWDSLEKRELRLSITHPPSNYFEKMALWTEQGKLWRFPIDNEQDIGAEAEVDFSEHVFLEEQLEPWCPKKGPVRHFMELVTVGLSKNPYMSVREKHDHINFYKEYFESKKDLLQQIIVESKTGDKKELSNQ
ncbi:small ribosomal subunit protein mS31 [Culicoides brevitarsis]|uniref:small ribosomal subunit protein mS31 n=1 Tax=Culicoides brevitarsis TaxID=469753 RepID=UPI00307CB65E